MYLKACIMEKEELGENRTKIFFSEERWALSIIVKIPKRRQHHCLYYFYIYTLGNTNPSQYIIIFPANIADLCPVRTLVMRSLQSVVRPDYRNKS